jgi:hypothetical protein
LLMISWQWWSTRRRSSFQINLTLSSGTIIVGDISDAVNVATELEGMQWQRGFRLPLDRSASPADERVSFRTVTTKRAVHSCRCDLDQVWRGQFGVCGAPAVQDEHDGDGYCRIWLGWK